MELTREAFTKLLMVNDKAVGRALVALNKRQTQDEQANENTRHNNGAGFTPADARLGTSMANFYAKAGFLTLKQVQYWRKPNAKGVPRIVKYSTQLIEIAKENERLKKLHPENFKLA